MAVRVAAAMEMTRRQVTLVAALQIKAITVELAITPKATQVVAAAAVPMRLVVTARQPMMVQQVRVVQAKHFRLTVLPVPVEAAVAVQSPAQAATAAVARADRVPDKERQVPRIRVAEVAEDAALVKALRAVQV